MIHAAMVADPQISELAQRRRTDTGRKAFARNVAKQYHREGLPDAQTRAAKLVTDAAKGNPAALEERRRVAVAHFDHYRGSSRHSTAVEARGLPGRRTEDAAQRKARHERWWRKVERTNMAQQYEFAGLSPAEAAAKADKVAADADAGDPVARKELGRVLAARLDRYRRTHFADLEAKRIAGRRTDEVRRRLSFSYWLTQLLSHLKRNNRREFSTCTLCGLLMFDCRLFHRWCADLVHRPAMAAWRLKRGRGRPRKMVHRDLIWLVGVRARDRLSSLPLSRTAQRRWKEQLTNRRLLALAPPGQRPRTPRAVEAVASALVPILPGSWSVAISRRKMGRDKRSPGDHYGRVLENWNLVLPLPELVNPLVDRGDRNKLIRRLLQRGMPMERIAMLTGASLDRVRGLAAQPDNHVLRAIQELCDRQGRSIAFYELRRRFRNGRRYAGRELRDIVEHLRQRREVVCERARLGSRGCKAWLLRPA